MDAARWQFVSDHFEAALDLTDEQRRTWLDLLERRDPQLVSILRAMLEDHARVEQDRFMVDALGRSPKPCESPRIRDARPRPSPTETREPRPRIDRIVESGDQESSADQ